jgi:hypothetical protein
VLRADGCPLAGLTAPRGAGGGAMSATARTPPAGTSRLAAQTMPFSSCRRYESIARFENQSGPVITNPRPRPSRWTAQETRLGSTFGSVNDDGGPPGTIG